MIRTPRLNGIQGNSARRDRDLVVVSFDVEPTHLDQGERVCLEMLRELGLSVQRSRFVFTCVPEHEHIAGMINGFCDVHPSTRCISPLPQEAYIRLLQEASFCIGNTSSLVIEAPWVGVPVVLVGDRQRDMKHGARVIHTDGATGTLDAIGAVMGFNFSWNPAYGPELLEGA